jgi:hypothetical protein
MANDEELIDDEELEDLEEDPEDLDDDEIDPDLDDDLDDDDVIAVDVIDPGLDDDVDVDEEDAEEEEPAPVKAKRGDDDEEGDEEDEEADPDDVEADLDAILKDRIAAAEEEEDDEEEEAPEAEVPGDGAGRIQPRRPGEFVCQSCFLVKHPSQLADEKHLLCADCV